MADNNACESKEWLVVVLPPAGADFYIEEVACLGLAQQEALDAPSDQLVMYVLLEVVLGGNHALIEADLLKGVAVERKEREHSVEHGPYFVNLVGLAHGFLCLLEQVQEAPEVDEVVTLYEMR